MKKYILVGPYTKNRLIIAIILIFCLSVLGCGADTSKAQSTTRINTFIILSDTLSLIAEDPVTVEISDNSTKYTLNSEGKISFTKVNSDQEGFNLENSDIIIERPATETLTIIRN